MPGNSMFKTISDSKQFPDDFVSTFKSSCCFWRRSLSSESSLTKSFGCEISGSWVLTLQTLASDNSSGDNRQSFLSFLLSKHEEDASIGLTDPIFMQPLIVWRQLPEHERCIDFLIVIYHFHLYFLSFRN